MPVLLYMAASFLPYYMLMDMDMSQEFDVYVS
jgi:hypothetical protein